MNFEKYYCKYMHIAQSINEIRNDMRSTSKCIAIYLYNKHIVSIGMNKCKSHPLLIKLNYDKYHYFSIENLNSIDNKNKRPQYPIHAELDGYIKLLNNYSNFNTLFIYRGNHCNMSSEPCYVCSMWLRKIDKLTICYINKLGEFTQINSNNLIGHIRSFNKKYNNYDNKFVNCYN